MNKNLFLPLFIIIIAPSFLWAQTQDEPLQYQSLQHALFSGGQLSGERGPQNVQWIEGGERYSYMVTDSESGTSEIRAFDPSNGT
ncbi:MAG TPA: hypothetical protein VJ915_12195, partial [Balneolaceae bacterium]|nr:hypothetical protein [Balneolaceae bacterium]